MLAMTEHEDDRQDAVVRPETIEAKVSLPPPTVAVTAGTLTVMAAFTADAEVVKPALTTVGVPIERAMTIRYSSPGEDGIRYVEIVDGKGELVVNGMGEAAKALWDLLLYLLPSDHPDFPTD
jgi:hypothetical protein